MKRLLLGTGLAWGLLGLVGEVEGQRHVRPGDVPFGAVRPLTVMGGRLQEPGKERLELLGVLTQAGRRSAVRIVWEYPGRVRIEKRVEEGERDPQKKEEDVVVYDGGRLRRSRGVAGMEEENLVEMLVHDSVEGFFIGQLAGFATRFLGSRYRRVDEEGNAVGPDYDLYEVIDEVGVEGRPQRQRKLYYFNSDTALLERVRYRLGPDRGRGEVEVRVEVSGWGEVYGERIPGRMARYEDGVEVVALEVREVAVGPKAEDGSFNLP